ncbi:OLC1v1033555C1 [Oldenlandia corymbosa var. corymbosa]|uniref:OLC1v1033555C1 n=1 Tax=Oldenlandia corymbosa var. corymbosa TaxID=529605 RepID=A0AAV1CRF0_OLDCO|nr:OLC1v1033555C1 [Oldenlandia corymbosa var. corymbosa]
MGLKLKDQMRFGDEEENQSTLLDKYERLSFEVQLNQAILLGRSLSEPSTFGTRTRTVNTAAASPIPAHHHYVHQEKHPKSRFIHKLLNKLFSPKKFASSSSPSVSAPAKGVPKQDYCKSNKLWRKPFSRSLRRP